MKSKTSTADTQNVDDKATRRPLHRMVRGKGFKIHCAYVYPWLESTKTYRTKEQALKDLRKWQREAADKGQEIIGRIAPNDGDQVPRVR